MTKTTTNNLSPYQQMIQSDIDGYITEKHGQKPTNPKDGSAKPPSSNKSTQNHDAGSTPPVANNNSVPSS